MDVKNGATAASEAKNGAPATMEAKNGAVVAVDPRLAEEPEEDEEDWDMPVPPDGGWGWMVVFASFMIHVIGKYNCWLVMPSLMFSTGLLILNLRTPATRYSYMYRDIKSLKGLSAIGKSY